MSSTILRVIRMTDALTSTDKLVVELIYALSRRPEGCTAAAWYLATHLLVVGEMA